MTSVLAAVPFPGWEPHPDVWLLVALLAAGYAIAVTRLGPRWAVPGERSVTRLQVTCFSLGVLALWVASDWPIHDVAEQSLYTAHMIQHLVFSMVAAPLLLLGTPAWLMRGILRPLRLLHSVQFLARFLPALIVFNVVIVLTHWPAFVDLSLRSGLVHFLAHALILLSSLIIWLPVVSPLPEVPRLTPAPRMIFLFLQSVVPTVPASFLTFGNRPLYHYYESVPQLFGLTALEDQRMAGLVMKLGAGLLLWLIIAVIFFRWAAEEERRSVQTRKWQDLDRELNRMELVDR
jgi:putative membrane protein